jgi:hypothetical protein
MGKLCTGCSHKVPNVIYLQSWPSRTMGVGETAVPQHLLALSLCNPAMLCHGQFPTLSIKPQHW